MTGVYKIIDQKTQEIYIGQSINIEERWKTHLYKYKNKRNNKLLYQAMRRDGAENFSFEVIEECSQEELNQKEIYWIQYYHCSILDPEYVKGLNFTIGGEGSVQYDINEVYSLWDEGYGIKQIADKINCSTTTVSRYLHYYKNYSATIAKKRGASNSSKAQDKKIIQYDLQGNYIAEWNSQKEIQRELNIDACTIGKVIRGKRISAGGFQWKLEGDQVFDVSSKAHTGTKKIGQYNIQTDELIQIFPSIKEAAKQMHCDPKNIANAAKGEGSTNLRQTACGFKWRYIS